MTAPLLEVEDLAVSYGRVPAVTDVSLRLLPGEIVTVIGANGAGKSTLLNAVMGMLPARGTVRLDGEAVSRMPVEERVRRGLSLVPERRELFSSMSVLDNLALGGFHASKHERTTRLEAVFTRFPRLKERRAQDAGTLSGGERQMLAMARALMAGPRVLMLDEPSLGLAPRIVAEILGIIGELRRSGVAILLVEQNARAALAAADRAHVMELGVFTLEGPAARLAGDERVASVYLGL
ncbi:ABC transporter ATP-binding protein [Prosthecomicrobium sp. N25]|uniref:ABC transporter ATP-binding protein n=1 Tax=Prosthecomicrobium sp. N25 TaxID=3129254 RepID=UPI00307840B5